VIPAKELITKKYGRFDGGEEVFTRDDDLYLLECHCIVAIDCGTLNSKFVRRCERHKSKTPAPAEGE
jgi:hypothetical protein